MPRQFFNAPTDQSPMEPMLNIALRAGRKAALLIERSYARLALLEVESKRPNDFVTEVDRAAEREIISQLRKAYPDHSFRGEERGEQPGKNSDYEWVIDPLDGTTNFVHGTPHFSISLASKRRGHREHAVVVDPSRREEWTARLRSRDARNGR